MLTPPSPLTVSSLVREIKVLLEGHFSIVLVEGEISNLARPSSGHLYFTLKDAEAQLRCAIFRNRANLLRFRPQDGAHVLVRARITLYEPRGDLQLVVEHMEEAGLGALQRAFEQLKRRLAAEGLFEAARKRPLPALPHRIGIITSPSGAAVRDVLHVLERRFPLIPIRIYPTSVQGAGAADEIVAALRQANEDGACDVLLLVRGGGSLEDLWPFNEERVARAIAASRLPVISGVGHETDFTIADLVADARAPTPSAAASLAVPDALAMADRLRALEARLLRRMQDGLDRRAQQLDSASRHLFALHPSLRLERMGERLQHLTERLHYGGRRALLARQGTLTTLELRLMRQHPAQRLQRTEDRLEALRTAMLHRMTQTLSNHEARLCHLASHLHVLSPLATLNRGYAIIEDAEGKTVTHTAELAVGDFIGVRMQDGRLGCEIRMLETSVGS
ncbi:MAG: exodeoxyribonuclease VII large subunit [Halothiobacillaceae bacterium]